MVPFILHKHLTLTGPHCARPFIGLWKENISEMSLGLLWKVWCKCSKEALVLTCLLHWAWLKSEPHCWINAGHFLHSAHLAVLYHWADFYSPSSFRLVVAKHLKADVQHQCNIWTVCSVHLFFLNHCSRYFRPLECQLRSAFAGTQELCWWLCRVKLRTSTWAASISNQTRDLSLYEVKRTKKLTVFINIYTLFSELHKMTLYLNCIFWTVSCTFFIVWLIMWVILTYWHIYDKKYSSFTFVVHTLTLASPKYSSHLTSRWT